MHCGIANTPVMTSWQWEELHTSISCESSSSSSSILISATTSALRWAKYIILFLFRDRFCLFNWKEAWKRKIWYCKTSKNYLLGRFSIFRQTKITYTTSAGQCHHVYRNNQPLKWHRKWYKTQAGDFLCLLQSKLIWEIKSVHQQHVDRPAHWNPSGRPCNSPQSHTETHSMNALEKSNNQGQNNRHFITHMPERHQTLLFS